MKYILHFYIQVSMLLNETNGIGSIIKAMLRESARLVVEAGVK